MLYQIIIYDEKKEKYIVNPLELNTLPKNKNLTILITIL